MTIVSSIIQCLCDILESYLAFKIPQVLQLFLATWFQLYHHSAPVQIDRSLNAKVGCEYKSHLLTSDSKPAALKPKEISFHLKFDAHMNTKVVEYNIY